MTKMESIHDPNGAQSMRKSVEDPGCEEQGGGGVATWAGAKLSG